MSALDLDRITPTRPPAQRSPSGYQSWRELLFVHYRYPADLVRAVVPKELELDLWEDAAWIGIVPFDMQNIRVSWMPRPLGLDFLETNLRTYVHYRGEPGVYFFSLEATSRLAVQGARWGWSLPYHHATMATRSDEDGVVHYESKRSSNQAAALEVSYRVGEELGPSQPGSLEFFLLERYYLFSKHRGRVHKGHVHHVPYPARRATVLSISDGLIEAAGLPRAGKTPDAVHFSHGVDVDVFGPWPVE